MGILERKPFQRGDLDQREITRCALFTQRRGHGDPIDSQWAARNRAQDRRNATRAALFVAPIEMRMRMTDRLAARTDAWLAEMKNRWAAVR